MELGEKYPKAREVLIEIRDKKAKQLQNGDRNRALFHDVESINDYLKQSEATVALFKKMEEARSRSKAKLPLWNGRAPPLPIFQLAITNVRPVRKCFPLPVGDDVRSRF